MGVRGARLALVAALLQWLRGEGQGWRRGREAGDGLNSSTIYGGGLFIGGQEEGREID